MSDFLFSSNRMPAGKLAAELAAIYVHGTVECGEYHGAWGSLGVTRSRYNGFDAVETDSHLCVVVGGPVLCYRDNRFLAGNDRQEGTRAILQRWLAGNMRWDVDLSGPFAVLIIDKKSGVAQCITDLLMFTPVYQYSDGNSFIIGTHIDALARAAGQQLHVDEVSLLDFVLHYVVTFPYTAYENVRQMYPATVHRLCGVPSAGKSFIERAAPYWLPEEGRSYRSLRDAAQALRSGVADYIERVTEGMDHVAQFVSGGEDSRAVSGMLPDRLQRHAYVFLDSMNREGRIAEKVAAIYGSEFEADFRDPVHYLSILPEATALIGSGHQFFHAHSLRFDRKHNLGAYTAVFGGYIADALYKAVYARKPMICELHAFMPQVPRDGETRSRDVRNSLFPEEMLSKITERRRAHLEVVQGFRPGTAHEWFVLWPTTMRIAIPNLYSNRRLFASYEPFMANEAVKVSAAVPTSWKMNRRLFHRAFRRYFAKSWSLVHADGRLPYFPWWVNTPIQFGTLLVRKFSRRFGHEKGNQGPWNDWEALAISEDWKAAVKELSGAADRWRGVGASTVKAAFVSNELDVYQKVNLLQVCYQLQRTLDMENVN